MFGMLDELKQRRAGLLAEMEANIAAAGPRGGMRASEQRKHEALASNIAGLDERIGQLQEDADRKAIAARARVELGIGDIDEYGNVIDRESRGIASRIYTRAAASTADPGRRYSFVRDLCSLAINSADIGAMQRLQTYATEERALSNVSGAGGEFLPPDYLIDQYVALARPSRPFADACTKAELPRGTNVLYLPKVETGTATASQGTQNTAVVETDLTTGYVSAPVVTIAGQQTVSLQLIEQSPVNFDEIVFSDLTRDLAVQIDKQAINGTGASGQMLGALGTSGITTVTYTDTTPTVSKLIPMIAQAIGDVNATRYAPPSHIWMTPMRWAWLLAAEDSAGRPFVVPRANGPYNAAGIMTSNAAQGGPVGELLGIPVYVDASIPTNLGTGTNQDDIIVAKMDDLYLWEGATVVRALPQTLGNQLSVLLQVYQYSAFLAARYPQSIAVISGTGLTAPVFA